VIVFGVRWNVLGSREATGAAESLIVFEDSAAASAARDALTGRPPEKRVGVDADRVRFLTARAF
jgi:hypothetical protein